MPKPTTVTYGTGKSRIVLHLNANTGTITGCTTPMLPKEPSRKDPFGIAMDTLITVLMKLANHGLAMDSTLIRSAVSESLDQISEDWGDL